MHAPYSQSLNHIVDPVVTNLQSVIVNRSGIIEKVLTALFARGHLILEDVPGTGKTMLARALAQTFAVPFNRIQFTPDLLPSDITGTHIYNPKEHTFEFHGGPVFTCFLLADEINRGTPRTQSCLLQAMEEFQVTIDRKTYALERPFFVMATQNPIEREGSFILPYSELDRFMLKTSIGYPHFDEELKMIQDRKTAEPLDTLEPVCTAQDLLNIQEAIKTIPMEASLQKYLLQLVMETRDHEKIAFGASPRSGLQIYRFAQARAFLDKRSFCTPDDVQYAFQNCIPHRLVLQETATGVGNTPADITAQVLEKIPVPV